MNRGKNRRERENGEENRKAIIQDQFFGNQFRVRYENTKREHKKKRARELRPPKIQNKCIQYLSRINWEKRKSFFSLCSFRAFLQYFSIYSAGPVSCVRVDLYGMRTCNARRRRQHHPQRRRRFSYPKYNNTEREGALEKKTEKKKSQQ